MQARSGYWWFCTTELHSISRICASVVPLLAHAPSAPCGGPFRSVRMVSEHRARHFWIATASEVQERMQRANSRGLCWVAVFIAIHLQMHCKGTQILWHMQIKWPTSDFFAPLFLPVFCKKFRTPRAHGVRGSSAPSGSPFRSVRMQAMLTDLFNFCQGKTMAKM